MSTVRASRAAREEGGWRLWSDQALAVFRLELRKNFTGKRAVPLYLLALLPVALFSVRLLVPLHGEAATVGFSTMLYEAIFQSFILRFVVFFGCVSVFMNLFRGEFLDRSLHYYFLAPVRRDVLVVGKYLSGLFTTGLLFEASTVASFLLLYIPHGQATLREQLLQGPALQHLFWYAVVVALACIGYGSVFLLMGLLFRNPIIPAVVILGWESIVFLLPPLLKKVSVVYYLQSLCPAQLSGGTIEILAEPSPPGIAIPGIVGVTIVLLALAGLRIRRMQILYGAD